MSSYIERFERHIDVPEIGLRGQDTLARSSVLVIGAGGLGCPASLYLAAAGIGSIGLADADTVSLSNLQRQVLYGEHDVGESKVATAEKRLKEISSSCHVRAYPHNLDHQNAPALIASYDIVLDCTDNFETRFLVNRVCHALGKTLVSASLYHHDGQISVFKSYQGAPHPCYECLYARDTDKSVVPNCRQSGVVGPVAGILGTMQASTAINELLGIGELLSGWMFMFNALTFTTEKVKIGRKKNCPCCARENASADGRLVTPRTVSCAV